MEESANRGGKIIAFQRKEKLGQLSGAMSISIEELVEYQDQGYQIARIKNLMGMSEYVLRKNGARLLSVVIDERGDLRIGVKSKATKNHFKEAAKRFLRLSTSQGASFQTHEIDEATIISSIDSGVVCFLREPSVGASSPESKVEVEIPNNRRVDFQSSLQQLVGFVDSMSQAIPRPLVGQVMHSASIERFRISPIE